jgi:hypothetical protein
MLKPQNTYRDVRALVFIKPMISTTGQRFVNVFAEDGQFIFQASDAFAAEIISRAHGYTPVSVH